MGRLTNKVHKLDAWDTLVDNKSNDILDDLDKLDVLEDFSSEELCGFNLGLEKW